MCLKSIDSNGLGDLYQKLSLIPVNQSRRANFITLDSSVQMIDRTEGPSSIKAELMRPFHLDWYSVFNIVAIKGLYDRYTEKGSRA